MRRVLLIGFTVVLELCFVIGGSSVLFSQEKEEYTLEEITVTAEKRTVSLQELPSSVVAMTGAELVTQGKITTKQILEGVPNLVYRNNGGTLSNEAGGTNPNGNIAIRGIQRTQNSGGVNEILPAATATYVDEVYQGIGGNFDISRVEVLRGPQGTLYGRSATGGVVSFYTNDPKLSEFGGNASVEYGSASLINVQAAVNVPAGDMFAFRASAHYYSRDGYFDYNEKAGQSETKGGRLKALFQPSEALKVVLSGSIEEIVTWGGGPVTRMSGPDMDDIYIQDLGIEPEAGAPQKYSQISINTNYDFGKSTLTWIGGYHDYSYVGYGPKSLTSGVRVNATEFDWKTDWYHSEEVRWASDTEGPLSWLVGGNYFKHRFDTSQFSRQFGWPPEPGVSYEDAYLAIGFGQVVDGEFENYGLFTEETLKLSDDFRITAGLRYDKTTLVQNQEFYFNQHFSPIYRTRLNPPDFDPAKGGYAELVNDTHDYNNVTYKLRFEYDMTPDNMLYFLTATGFMPGYTAVSPTSNPAKPWNFLMLEQQKLTNYELGTKNQFLNDTLRVNAAAFYYDYEGYPEAVNVRYGDGPPTFTVLSVPLEVIGLEADVEYLITMNDKISLNAGYLRNEIAELPQSVEYFPGGPPGAPAPPPNSVAGGEALTLKQVPGYPEIKATLAYDHTFIFGGDSALVPRAELIYTSGYYLEQMSFQEVNLGQTPYNYRDALVLCNINATWTSANQMFAVTGYVRNAFDEEYKAGIDLDNVSNQRITVVPGEPRTYGVMLSVKF
jgi:outer membrane receptor protein involved in Fe transport